MHARAPAGPPACVRTAPRLPTAVQVRRGRAVPDSLLERLRRAERQCSHFSAQSSGRSSGGSGDLQDAALRFGRSAGKRLKETYDVAEFEARRAATRLDSRFDISGKVRHLAASAQTQAATLDSRLGVRRRARIVAEDAQRSWPKWRRQYKEFSGTRLGRAAFLGGVFLLFYTGLAFRLLNLLFLLWWIGPLIVLPLLQAASRKAVAEAQQREAAAAAARNPWSAFGRRPGVPTPGGAGGRRGGPAKQEGPVIDAEWTTIDDDM